MKEKKRGLHKCPWIKPHSCLIARFQASCTNLLTSEDGNELELGFEGRAQECLEELPSVGLESMNLARF